MSLNCQKLNLKWIIIFTVIVAQLSRVLTFVSKATIETVVPFDKDKIHLFSSSIGKVSRLFPARKSNVTRILKVTPASSTSAPPHVIAENEPQSLRFTDGDFVNLQKPLSSRFNEKTEGDLMIYDQLKNPFINSESWKDLNTVLGEDDMKAFLSSLPLHVLRNLTSMSRKNPELGQKQLVRMILDRSDNFKKEKRPLKELLNNKLNELEKNGFESHKKISGYKTNNLLSDNEINTEKVNQLYEKPNSIIAENQNGESQIEETRQSQFEESNQVETENNDMNQIHPSDPIVSTTSTAIPVLETPIFEKIKSTPPMDMERKHRLFPFSLIKNPPVESENVGDKTPSQAESQIQSEIITNESEGPRQFNSFNSGYYIPPITNDNDNKASANGDTPLRETKFSWQYDPQDPENTFEPNVDKFLKPPLEFNPLDIEDSNAVPSVLSSSVWVIDPSIKKNATGEKTGSNKKHPFSGFDSEIKLQPAATSDQIINNGDDTTLYQEHDGVLIEYNPPDEGSGIPFHPHPNYHYTQTTVHNGRPQNSHSIQGNQNEQNSHAIEINSQGIHFNRPQNKPNHKTRPNVNDNNYNKNNKPNENNNNNNNNNGQNQHQNSQPEDSPSENSENSPQGAFEDSSFHGNGWGGQDSSDWWFKAKNYFSKGGKSTSEKVFEISLAVLSFLAFGGYLLMLIYQVFAVSSAVPLFPVFSTNVPANPTLLNVLLGRSSKDQTFSLSFPGEKFEEKYIEELENIVKQAMNRVKLTVASIGESNENKTKGAFEID